MFEHDTDFAADENAPATIEDLFHGEDAEEAWEWATEADLDLRF